MGVPGFFSWLLKKKKKLGAKNLVINNLPYKVKWLMLDANCLLHPCVALILEKYKEGQLNINYNRNIRIQIEECIWEKITQCIDDMIRQTDPEYLYIAIDGVAPLGKILQQRQRRYKFLFDKKIKLNEINTAKEIDEMICKTILKSDGVEEPIVPLASIELTPGTDYMERLNKLFEKYIWTLKKQNIKCIYSSYHDEGEGEHKLLQYIKKNISKSDSIVIYGLDADLLFLSLGLGYQYDLYVMREKQFFTNNEIDLDEIPDYNYVEIRQLHILISNLEVSTNDFILMCYLIGNDFLPSLLTIDIKKGGLDKIFRAWDIFKNKNGIVTEYEDISGNNITNEDLKNLDFDEYKIKSNLVIYDLEKKKHKINLELLKGLFGELVWTEKNIWKNINRDKYLNQENLEPEDIDKLKTEIDINKVELMDKFIAGQTSNTEFLEKIEFSSFDEYYGYYLGISSIEINQSIIKKIVNEYILGLEWCVCYYLDSCPDWKWGYNFMIGPLIKDIVNFFPKSGQEIIFRKRTLNPVEQLILAIPIETYKYVLEKKIISEIKLNKNIGYMFPEFFQIDVNKEDIYWKCTVKIPTVNYIEFEKEIKKLNISNDKNLIYSSLKNF